jgi:hypothetical protein
VAAWKRETQVISVRLSQEEKERLEKEATLRGVPLSTCARMMMLEGLRAQHPASQAQTLLAAVENDLELRLLLRRLVLTDPRE